MQKRILVGISSCLLGEKVRFDGGHKRDNYLCDLLAGYVDFLPICPEVAIGMGIPRPAIRLIGDQDSPRLVEVKHYERDYTQAMLDFSRASMAGLDTISAYILKSKSPSCGWKRVKIYQTEGASALNGQGLFAKTLEEYYPSLPIEEEGRLNDPRLCENFIERLFVYKEWQDLVAAGLSLSGLLAFHTRHKLALMAHNPVQARALGYELSQLKAQDFPEFSKRYLVDLMRILTYMATAKKHANVLQHCLGYLKTVLTAKDKQELLESIDNYRQGFLPLIVPITLLKHHLIHHPQPYLEEQSYLNPYPVQLMLRNRI